MSRSPAVSETQTSETQTEPESDTVPSRIEQQVPEATAELLAGEVILEDVTGAVVFQTPALAVSGGWIALPVVHCYGAYKWIFIEPSGESTEIKSGILRDYDRVGVWRVDESRWVGGPDLRPWDPARPAEWFSLASEQVDMTLSPREYADLGRYARVELPRAIDGPGVFFQDDAVVGWSFGNRVPGGYMWIGDEGEYMTPFYRVEDFYRLTFSGSREENFLLALADKEATDAQLLSSLAGAFLLDTRIPSAGIPANLKTETIKEKMRTLVDRLMGAEQYGDLAYILDVGTLIVVRDESLALSAVEAVMAGEGADEALALIAALRENGPAGWFSPGRRMTKLAIEFYRKRIDELTDAEEVEAAYNLLQEARSLYPEDPGFYLALVRMTLDAAQWQDAEEMLNARDYPPSLQDTVENLRNRISDFKSVEGKTVVRFRPGSRYIPVQGILNGRVTQQFLIDTGATVSTIPSSSAKALGIKVFSGTSRREFYTAGGTQSAPAVNIRSLQVGEWTVNNLDALIVDLPRYPEMGLLGMNFLNQFKMDLNNQKGILVLEPR